MSVLYVFYTHQKMLENTKTRVESMMKNHTSDYLIVCGGEENSHNIESKILIIDCNDKYEGLPEKVLKSFKYLVEHEYFNNFNHFAKLDEDMIVNKAVPEKLLTNIDYCGRVQRSQGSRKYHFGKFSKDNPHYNKPYSGPFVPWCLGGYGYIISRRAIELIKDNTDFENAIYEDVYIAILLSKKKVFPKIFNNRSFFVSPVHKRF